jgi:hypothetical protein
MHQSSVSLHLQALDQVTARKEMKQHTWFGLLGSAPKDSKTWRMVWQVGDAKHLQK